MPVSSLDQPSDVEPCYQFVAVKSPLERRTPDTGRTIRAHVTTRSHQQRRLLGYRRRGGAVATGLEEEGEPDGHVSTEQRDSLISKQSRGQIRLCVTCHQPIGKFTPGTSSLASSSTGRHIGSHNHDYREQWPRNMEGYFPMHDTMTIASPSARNPFNDSSWIRISPDAYKVVDNFIGQYFEANRSSNSPMRSTIMLAGLTYTGLFHGHIYTSLVNVALLNGKASSSLTLRHKGYTIHFINESLGDDRQSCTDEVIATVLTLFNAECLAANIEAAETHMRGLSQMVKRRGGVDELGYDGQVKQILLVHDYILCTITSRLTHRFSLPISPNTSSLVRAQSPPDFRVFTLQKVFASPTDLPSVSSSTMTVLDHLQRFTSISQDWHAGALTEFEKTVLANKWLSVRSSLLGLPSSSTPIVSIVTDDYVYEACRLAAILLSCKYLQTIDPYFSLIAQEIPSSNDLNCLRISLERTNLFQFWHPVPGALIWILAIGANVAPRGSLKSWFLAHLARTCIVHALTQWDEVEISLKTILYSLKDID